MPIGVYPHPRKTYPAPLVDRARNLYEAGGTQVAVAGELGIPRQMLQTLMRNHGIVARPHYGRLGFEGRLRESQRGPTECWLWAGAVNNKGYGVFRVSPKCHYAHRASYEVHVGPIPEGMELDHLCATPRCVNPAHLEPVTHAENLLRHHARRRESIRRAEHRPPFVP